MIKTYNEALDYTLSSLKEEHDTNGLQSLTIDNWRSKVLGELAEKYHLQHWEIQNIFVHLKADGYIGEKFALSLKGSSFIKNGGYSKEHKYFLVRRFIDFFEVAAIILGGVCASAYYFSELFLK